MRMIQTAVQLQDVLPTAAASSGMRAVASPRSPEQGAGFEKMLQFSRAAGAEAMNARPGQVVPAPSQAQAGRPGMAQGKQQGGEPVAESLTLAQMAGDAGGETDEAVPGEPDEALAAMLKWDLLMPEAGTSVAPAAGAKEEMLQVALKQDVPVPEATRQTAATEPLAAKEGKVPAEAPVVSSAGASVEWQQAAPVATDPVREQAAQQVQATAAQHVQATAAQQVRATAAQQVQATAAQQVQATAAQQVQATAAQQVQATAAQQVQATAAHQVQATAAQQVQATAAQQVQATAAQQVQATAAQQVQATAAQQVQATAAQQVQATAAQQVQATAAQQVQATAAQQVQATEAQQVQATEAQEVQAPAAQQVQATAAPSGDAVPAMSVSAGRQQPAPHAADTVRQQPAPEIQVASAPPGSAAENQGKLFEVTQKELVDQVDQSPALRVAERESGARAGSTREAESVLVQKAAAQGSATGTLSRTEAPEELESAGVARQDVGSEDAPAGEAAPKTAQVQGVTVQSSQKQGPVLQEAQSGARIAEGQVRQQDEKVAQQALVREPVAKAEPEVAEQMVVAPRSQGQVAGKETASTPATGAVSSPAKQAGGEHSGAAGEDRPFEQKMQVAQAGAGESSAVGAQAAEEGKFAQAVDKADKADKGHSPLHQNVLSQIRDGVIIHDGKGNGQMSIRLNPGELGELKIQIRMEDHRLKVEVQAENRTVKDLLMSNLDSLKQALSGKNLDMEGFDVSTGGGGFNSPAQEQRENHRQAMRRSAMGVGYPAGEERQVRYSTPDGNSLLDVRL